MSTNKYVTFQQIKADKSLEEKDGFGVTLLHVAITLVMGYVLYSLDIHKATIIVLVFYYWLDGQRLIRPFFGDFAKPSDVIGEVKFVQDCITWQHEGQVICVEIQDISSLHLRYNYVQGKSVGRKDIIHNGLAKLTIHNKTGEQSQFKFLITSKAQLKDLTPIWKEYYKGGIKMKETLGKYELKTILFEVDTNISFEKMQELKKELNVSSFY